MPRGFEDRGRLSLYFHITLVIEYGQILNTKTKNKKDRLIKQALDLAKLSQNLLKGEDLTQFIQRSVDLIK